MHVDLSVENVLRYCISGIIHSFMVRDAGGFSGGGGGGRVHAKNLELKGEPSQKLRKEGGSYGGLLGPSKIPLHFFVQYGQLITVDRHL